MNDKLKDLTDDQLRSAITNLGASESELKNEMLMEAHRRALNSLGLTRTCRQPDDWFYFFKARDLRDFGDKGLP